MSWRTSLAGVLVIVSQLAALLPSVPSWLSTVLHVLGALAGGAGLVLARDHAAPQITLTPEQRAMLQAAAQPVLKAPSEDGKADP